MSVDAEEMRDACATAVTDRRYNAAQERIVAALYEPLREKTLICENSCDWWFNSSGDFLKPDAPKAQRKMGLMVNS